MTLAESTALVRPANADPSATGRAMYALVEELFPICRSITGRGVRETLRIVGQHVPLEIHEVPTGTQVFDWEVPREWNIQDAFIQADDGRRIVDFQASNLHVVNYSIPVRTRLTWKALQQHLFTLPDKPDLVPYRTSYYQPTWGFCLSHRQWSELDRQYAPDSEFDVCIDATLEPGSLTYGELLIPGRTCDEVLFSCHVCHPSLANDNLSGIAVATHLAQHVLAMADRRYSYRFLFIPGTIGAITWLAQNQAATRRIRHGLVLALLGAPGPFHFKRSRQGTATIDRVAAHVLKHSGEQHTLLDFEPYGYDERQFCSPGFNLPVGSLSRTPYGRYPEYHTSGDNLELVRGDLLADSLAQCVAMVDVLERDGVYMNQNPYCEPQLGRRGLYRAVGGQQDRAAVEQALLWVLNFSDGKHSLLDIAERSGLSFATVHTAAQALLASGLLQDMLVPNGGTTISESHALEESSSDCVDHE